MLVHRNYKDRILYSKYTLVYVSIFHGVIMFYDVQILYLYLSDIFFRSCYPSGGVTRIVMVVEWFEVPLLCIQVRSAY